MAKYNSGAKQYVQHSFHASIVTVRSWLFIKKEVCMLTFIYKALHSFRDAFSRKSTWMLSCMVVLGFMGLRQGFHIGQGPKDEEKASV